MAPALLIGELESRRVRSPVGDRPAGRRADAPYIAPVAAGMTRPFWSVMVPVHNCPPHYLRETLQSVLRQDPGPCEMQIEVIDNCSTSGDPETVVRELGGGRIAFRRQAENVGMVENFNDCIRHATGRWVHILHGDDTVRPGFYERLRSGIAEHPEVGAALCRIIYTDEEGQWSGLTEPEARAPGILAEDFVQRQFLDQRIQFAAIVVRREVYEELGGFVTSFVHCLDWDMWKRIALRKPIYYDPEPLACYRLHAAADSSKLMRTGENVIEERRSIEISCADFPPEKVAVVRRAAMKAAGIRAARRARQLWKAGDRATAWRQFREAARCGLAFAVTARLIYFLLRIVLR
jgi:GT2 family glycosyltransferase